MKKRTIQKIMCVFVMVFLLSFCCVFSPAVCSAAEDGFSLEPYLDSDDYEVVSHIDGFDSAEQIAIRPYFSDADAPIDHIDYVAGISASTIDFDICKKSTGEKVQSKKLMFDISSPTRYLELFNDATWNKESWKILEDGERELARGNTSWNEPEWWLDGRYGEYTEEQSSEPDEYGNASGYSIWCHHKCFVRNGAAVSFEESVNQKGQCYADKKRAEDWIQFWVNSDSYRASHMNMFHHGYIHEKDLHIEEFDMNGKTVYFWYMQGYNGPDSGYPFPPDRESIICRYYILDECRDIPGVYTCTLVQLQLYSHGADYIDKGRNRFEEVKSIVLSDMVNLDYNLRWEGEGSSSGKVNQVTETTASENPGEDEGTPINPDIIGDSAESGNDNRKKDGRNPGGAAAGAVLVGAAVAVATMKKKKGEGRSRYMMKLYKNFGDTLRAGEPQYVYAKIVEIKENGVMVDRNDLTALIRIYAGNDAVNVTQTGMSGEWNTGYVELKATEGYEDAVVSFAYTGAGGTFTENVHFKVSVPKIKFYQPNIALVSGSEDGGKVAFTLEGFDLDKVKIELSMSFGASYRAAYCDSVDERGVRIPGTYYAVLADINTDKGESGTWTVDVMTVSASDGAAYKSEEFCVYRVNPGLNISTDYLNCFRVLKKEAAQKSVNELVPEDFEISSTKAYAMVLKVDEEAQEMYYEPAQPDISIEPLDSKDADANSLAKERLDGIGLTAKLSGAGESMCEYTFYCEKGWLEPPIRMDVKLRATFDTVENGEKVTYECEKEVKLFSQPFRQTVTDAQHKRDMEIWDWIMNVRSTIIDLGMMEDLGGEYMMLHTLTESYDEHFGYDSVLIAQIGYNVQQAIHNAKRNFLEKRQRHYENMRDTAHEDNNYWTIASKSFAMVSSKYLDTWGGIAARIGLGLCTGGLSEAAFLSMDVNKAVSQYNERTLLKDRSLKGKLFAGSVPVLVSATVGVATMGAAYSVRALVPPEIAQMAKGWVMRQTGAVMSKIPQEYVFATKNLYKRFTRVADKINSYDPRRKMLSVRNSAAQADSAVAAARLQAEKDIIKIRGKALSPEARFKQNVQRAGELKAAEKVDRFKRAVDRLNTDESPAAIAEYRDAFFEVEKDTFALRNLNQEGKTGAQIMNGEKLANPYRGAYNKAKADFMEKPAEELMLKKAASVTELKDGETVALKRVSGKTVAEREAGYTVSFDSDNSIVINNAKTGESRYLSQASSDEIVAKSYCEATGMSFTDKTDAMMKAGEMKVVAVTPEHPEYILEVSKFKSTAAYSEEAILHNIGTSNYKMTSVYDNAEFKLKKLLEDPAKAARIEKECIDYISRSGPGNKLSGEAMEAIACMENQLEGLHQVYKTYEAYSLKDMHGMGAGKSSGFSSESRVFSETCRLVENQGMYNLDLGELHELLKLKGITYQQGCSELVTDFYKVNANCAAAEKLSAGLGSAVKNTVGQQFSGVAFAGVNSIGATQRGK